MAEMKRDVSGEIQASLVAPPQQNNWGAAIKGILKADASISASRLIGEQEAEQNRQMDEGLQAQLETQQATNQRVTQDNSAKVFDSPEGQDAELSPLDTREVADIRTSFKRNTDGMAQGATTHQESLINQELILRRAIARRPWLRDEFIKASTGFLQVDVYQRGYMALAENEASRLTANDAAKAAEDKVLEDEGKKIMESNFVAEYISANPTDVEGAQTLASIRYNAVALAKFYKSVQGTPKGEATRFVSEQVEGVKNAASFAKDNQNVDDARLSVDSKRYQTEMAEGFGTSVNTILTDKDMFDEQGVVRSEKVPELTARLDAQLLAVNEWERATSAKLGSTEVTSRSADVYRSQITSMRDMLTGGTSGAITKAQIETMSNQAKYASMTNPSVAAVALSLMKAGITDPAMATNRAWQIAGDPVKNETSLASIRTIESGLGTQSLNIVTQGLANLQDPSLGVHDRNIARDSVRVTSEGIVIRLSNINKDDMSKSFSASGQARALLKGFATTMLATEKTGDMKGQPMIANTYTDPDQQKLGGAYQKSVYMLQESIVRKTTYNSNLENIRQSVKGGSVLSYAVDGSIIVNDKRFYNGSPAEQSFMQEIDRHNAWIKETRAGEVMTQLNGRAPIKEDRKTVEAHNFGKAGMVDARMSSLTAVAPLSYAPKGSTPPGKSQGARPPIGTKVFEKNSRDSLIGYAEGLRGAESGGSFNVQYGGKKVPVTDMTVQQVLAYQEGQKAQGKQTAIGAYQFTQATLKDALKRAGVDENAKFDVKTQNKIMKAHTEHLAQQASGTLGRAPTYGEMYLLHFQGEGDGKAMLAAGRNASVDSWFSPAEKAKNPAYAEAKTVGDLIDILDSKWS